MDTIAVVSQDQLIPQSDGSVTASFPGRPEVISVQPDGRIEERPAGTAGDYEKAHVTKAGHLLYRPLGTGGQSFVIAGADLQ